VHKDYWIAIIMYAVAVVLTALPFLGIIEIDLGLEYATLKFLHIVFVFVAISILIGQLIAFRVMQHARITTTEALEYLSLLDYAIPVCLLIIGILGYSMAAQHGRIWEVEWIHEAAFGLFVYTFFGLLTTIFFRRTRMNLDAETRSSVGVYVASGVGIAFLVLMTGIMVYRASPFRTAYLFTDIARYFSGVR
jgi:uncharacterized membrane protein SirB2